MTQSGRVAVRVFTIIPDHDLSTLQLLRRLYLALIRLLVNLIRRLRSASH